MATKRKGGTGKPSPSPKSTAQDRRDEHARQAGEHARKAATHARMASEHASKAKS